MVMLADELKVSFRFSDITVTLLLVIRTLESKSAPDALTQFIQSILKVLILANMGLQTFIILS